MKSLISIRLNNEILQEMKARANLLHLSQTEYIRQAIERMNREAEGLERSERLKKASLRVRNESMKINAEFSEIDYDPKA